MMACCIRFSISMEAGNDTLGSRIVCGATDPSFRVGINSVPSDGTKDKAPMSAPMAIANTAIRCPSAQWRAGAWIAFAILTIHGSSSLPCLRASEQSTGDSVSERSSDTRSAIIMV